MHFEHEGRSLWYGTPDALAPEEAFQAGTEIAITIGVSPVDASNYVELLYRVNQGPTEGVAAKWVQNDPSGKAQYFRARLPAFRAGDIVEYIPICSCAGRQVPSPDQARQFASSIRVTEAEAKSAPGLAKREIPLLRIGDSGDEVARLHKRLELHDVGVSPEERKRKFFGPTTREAVCECQKRHGLEVTGEVNESTAAALSTPVAGSPAFSDAATPRPTMESPTLPHSSAGSKSMKPITPPLRHNDRSLDSDKVMFAVEGKVVIRGRAGVDGLRVEIVDKNVGKDVRLAEAVTDDVGAYRATFSIAYLHERGKQWPDLQARVFAGEIFLGASEVRYNASSRETLNVLLTEMAASALASEHETLVGALSAHCRG
ncbi:MAG: peptidoglycan-binding domain-containing protein, partial [Pyrinomonadaceae bacterium]